MTSVKYSVTLALLAGLLAAVGCQSVSGTSRAPALTLEAARQQWLDAGLPDRNRATTEVTCGDMAGRMYTTLNNAATYTRDFPADAVALVVRDMLLHEQRPNLLRAAIVIGSPDGPLRFHKRIPDAIDVLRQACPRYNATQTNPKSYEILKVVYGDPGTAEILPGEPPPGETRWRLGMYHLRHGEGSDTRSEGKFFYPFD